MRAKDGVDNIFSRLLRPSVVAYMDQKQKELENKKQYSAVKHSVTSITVVFYATNASEITSRAYAPKSYCGE